MVFDSRITELRNHFGITTPEDWRDVAPSWITSLHGFGPGILNYLRLELAVKGLTLRDDKTAEFWRQHLAESHITQPLGDPDDEDNRERHVVNPFTVLIDSAEQAPLKFEGIRQDAADGGRPIIVPTEWRALGRHPLSYGDYAIDGYERRCCVERKSMADAHGTILGWGERRERFESELSNLAGVTAAGGCSLVVVECSLQALVANAPEWGKRTAKQNAKSLHRSVIAFMQDYPGVGWCFADSRRLAEVTTFQFMNRFWRKVREGEEQANPETTEATTP